MKLKLYILFFVTTTLFAQKVETSIDKTKAKIGAQFTVTFKTSVDANMSVLFPKEKNFGKLEVIESYPIDTIVGNSRNILIKKYGLTQFDSGKYTIPRVKILINKIPVFSDSIKVEVFNVKVDTLKQKMHDIKPIIQVETPTSDWWKYILGLVAFAAAGINGYYFYKKKKNQKEKPLVYNSPIEKATSLMQLLEKKELLANGEIKAYYSELTDITRDYIEEAINIPAKESTTSELIAALRIASTKKKMKLSKETLLNLEKVLKQADLVKFAQVKPLDFEIASDKEKLEKTINIINYAIPVTIDENNKKRELLKEKNRLKEKKKKQTIAFICSIYLLIIIPSIYIISTKGINYVLNGFSGVSTKELLNENWIKSSYGNPNITIETPKVLKRNDKNVNIPSDQKADLKEVSSFVYGNIESNFYIELTTMKPKKESDYDLEKGMNQVVASITGENLSFNKQEFTTQKGTKGLKGFGEKAVLNLITKKVQKMTFNIVLFKENSGVQQVSVLFLVNDSNATEISERILNSIEFQTNN